MSPIDPGGFLLEDYKQKIAYLTNHFSRMWMRFNFFVALETALLGGSLLLLREGRSPIIVVVSGAAMSLIWYVMGAQDRYLVDLYRWQVKRAAGRIEKTLSDLVDRVSVEHNLRDEALAAAREYVGRVDPQPVDCFEKEREQRDEEGSRMARALDAISAWRSDRFSTTRLAAWIPLVLFCLWAVYLVYQIIRFFLSEEQGAGQP